MQTMNVELKGGKTFTFKLSDDYVKMFTEMALKRYLRMLKGGEAQEAFIAGVNAGTWKPGLSGKRLNGTIEVLRGIVRGVPGLQVSAKMARTITDKPSLIKVLKEVGVKEEKLSLTSDALWQRAEDAASVL